MPQSTIYRADRSDGSSRNPHPAVATYGLARLFGGVPALVDVSMRIEPGRTVALLGANGAGKTTLLRLLATAIRPRFGRVEIDGVDAVAQAPVLRAGIAYLSHAPGLYDGLTLGENLEFAARLRGLEDGVARDRVSAAVERVGLAAFASERVAGFSAGMRRRAALARVLIARPRLILLDEPYAALDETGLKLVDGLLAEWHGEGATCVVASHATERLTELADATAYLEAGQLAGLEGEGVTRTTAAPARTPSPQTAGRAS